MGQPGMMGSKKAGKTTQSKPSPRSPPAAKPGKHSSMSVDPIDNGFIVTRTETTKVGVKQSRVFSKTAPDLSAVVPKG